jgi:hypothetical protein
MVALVHRVPVPVHDSVMASEAWNVFVVILGGSDSFFLLL